MPFQLEFEPAVKEHLKTIHAHDRVIVLTAIRDQLPHQAAIETKHRKPLSPNPLASWELRVGDYRIFYDVIESDQLVRIVAIGRKEHNRLFIAGSEYEL